MLTHLRRFFVHALYLRHEALTHQIQLEHMAEFLLNVSKGKIGLRPLSMTPPIVSQNSSRENGIERRVTRDSVDHRC